jgi:predicted acetyltransferase
MTAIAVAPAVEHEPAFLAMLADFDARDAANAAFYAPARADFSAYVRNLLDEERGLNLREGWVPCTHRWLLGPGRAVVGVARLRHHIGTPFLANHGGHIGYDVAPSRRGRGHGHAVLRAALVEARVVGLRRVLLYTAAANAASRAVIERQGGALEAISYSAHWKEHLCKYWIEVPHPAG